MVCARRLNSDAVIHTFTELFCSHCKPVYIRSENAPEPTAKAVRRWLCSLEAAPLYVEPGNPWENHGNLSLSSPQGCRSAGHADASDTQWQEPVMNQQFSTKPLDSSTWEDFAALVERHNGVWGGCWCLEFHPEGAERGPERRARKESRVRAGTSHAALVYAGSTCVGWCQFGSPEELPRIKHQRAYRKDLERLPDWRITCFFVDKERRKQGVSAIALAGAQ